MTKSISIKILKHFIVDGCEVKFADVTPLAAPVALDAALRQLSHHRRDKTLRYRFERGKLLSAGVGLLLDDMLRSRGLRERDMRYVEGEHGKLAFEQYPDLHFSLSHSGTLVACAVGDVALGVDVQTIVTARESLVNYIMSDNEKAKLQTLDEEARNAYFTQLWTLKESYAKATGKGLTHDFPAFEVASDGEVRVLSALNPPARFFTTALDGAQGAVAMLEEKK